MKYNKVIKKDFEKLGKRIQILREERKISLMEMSCKTKIRKEYLQKIEQGTAYHVLLNKHLVKIAIALEVDITNLFE